MESIRQWVERTFGGPESTLILELGAHRGEDTAWMAAIPGVTLHSLEPDPRARLPGLPNVTFHRKAVAAHDGTCRFLLSTRHRNPFLTGSFSSIRAPKTCQERFPYVEFGQWVEVQCVTLDTLIVEQRIERIDFLWADVQGAERDMVTGGREALARTRYLYTEVCPDGDEWYEGQAAYSELLTLLPGFSVVERWPRDVLLRNEGVA